MTNAENNHKVGNLQRDKVEPKEYVDAQSKYLGEQKEMYGESLLMRRVVSRENMERAIKRVRQNKGAPNAEEAAEKLAFLTNIY